MEFSDYFKKSSKKLQKLQKLQKPKKPKKPQKYLSSPEILNNLFVSDFFINEVLKKNKKIKRKTNKELKNYFL